MLSPDHHPPARLVDHEDKKNVWISERYWTCLLSNLMFCIIALFGGTQLQLVHESKEMSPSAFMHVATSAVVNGYFWGIFSLKFNIWNVHQCQKVQILTFMTFINKAKGTRYSEIHEDNYIHVLRGWVNK